MKKTMKKALMMLALLVAPIAMQAQTKFHDVELNECTGPVKSISTSFMGRDQVTNFSQDGKMQREGMGEVVYDENGYAKSVEMEGMQGQKMKINYTWENGKVKTQTMDMMGQGVTITLSYNDKGAIAAQSMNLGGQEMSTPYTDYKYDDHGNWIYRKSSMMGRDMEQSRTITYYE